MAEMADQDSDLGQQVGGAAQVEELLPFQDLPVLEDLLGTDNQPRKRATIRAMKM